MLRSSISVLASLFLVPPIFAHAQTVALTATVSDLPFTTYGGALRYEPNAWLYMEATGSYRPLRERLTEIPVFGSGTNVTEGTAFDFSIGVARQQQITGRLETTVSAGPFFQRKRLRGTELPDCGLFGCSRSLPLKWDTRTLGGRVSLSMRWRYLYYATLTLGVGHNFYKPSSDIGVDRTPEVIADDPGGFQAHARLSVGIQLGRR